MSDLQTGLVGIALLFLLLATSMPVAFAMTLVGVVGFAVAVNVPAALHVLATDYYDVFSSYGLTVIPLFVFMGQVAFHAGISRKLFAAAQNWFGWLRGGWRWRRSGPARRSAPFAARARRRRRRWRRWRCRK